MQNRYKNQSVQELVAIAVLNTNIISDRTIELNDALAELESRVDVARSVQLELF